MSEEQSLSAQLRSAREQRGMSIEDIQRQTGLSPNVLRGLEADRFDVVEAVITRLTLRDYVAYLGLDVDALLAQYDRIAGQAVKPVRQPPIPLAPKPVKAARRTSGANVLRWAVPAAVALIVLFLLYHFFGGEPDRSRSGFTPSDPPLSRTERARPAPAPTTRDQREAATPAGREAQTAEEEAVPAETGDTASSAAGALRPPETGGVSPAGPGSAATALPTEDRETAPLAAVALAAETGSGHAAEERPAAADSLLRLQVEAVDDTWVEIKGDSRVLFQGILTQGERRSWTAREAFHVHSGRAHGLRYWFQGRLLGGGHLGDPAQVLRFRASRTGVSLLDADLQPLEELSLQSDEQP